MSVSVGWVALEEPIQPPWKPGRTSFRIWPLQDLALLADAGLSHTCTPRQPVSCAAFWLMAVTQTPVVLSVPDTMAVRTCWLVEASSEPSGRPARPCFSPPAGRDHASMAPVSLSLLPGGLAPRCWLCCQRARGCAQGSPLGLASSRQAKGRLWQGKPAWVGVGKLQQAEV